MKILLISALLVFSITGISQPLLKTTEIKYKEYNNQTKTWSNWSEYWLPAIVKWRFTKIDLLGVKFRVEIIAPDGNQKTVSAYYIGYNSENNWFQYKVNNSSDYIAIEGVKMSYLSEKGWPSYDVKIYFSETSSGNVIVCR